MKIHFTIIILLSFFSINAQNTISFKKSDFDLPSVISELFEAKYNTQTKKLTPIETISSVGRDYPNSVIYGFNLIKTKLNNPPLRLIAES